MKKLRVTVDGKPFDVTVEILDKNQESPAEQRRSNWTPPPTGTPGHSSAPPTSVSAPATTPTPQRDASGQDGVPSPLAGKVVSIDVQPGQTVEANAQLITLEAMKMNTYVFAPAAGTVKDILVKVGDSVEEGQVLIKIA